MYNISLSNSPRQEITTTLSNGDYVKLSFEFKPNQMGWYFGFEYNDVSYQNIRLTTSYNVLRAYRNWLPFGIRIDTSDGFEPMDLNDFQDKYATLYLLDKSELQAIESNYYAKV